MKPHAMKHRKQTADHQSIIEVGQAQFGGNNVVMVAGPCAVESEAQLMAVGETLKALGIPCLRGGAFKPRTSPYSFQGMGLEGLELMAQVGAEFGLGVITEVMSLEQIQIAHPLVDCFQVGSRNMQNFELLKALGKTDKPILLKRGLSATLDEFLMAAEYIMAEGNEQVILCERGIRSFDNSTRNVLDLAAVALLKEKTHLPVIVDPSHATGIQSLITPTSKAAVAVGADALIVEAHPNPLESVSDADQALSLAMLADLMHEVNPVAIAIGRPLQDTRTAALQMSNSLTSNCSLKLAV
jgi:3-deoxy-7-phosphoheptulonate synthase